MAHVAKYTRAQTGQLCQHYERKMNEKGEYVKFGNEKIDLEKTHLNYNLAPEQNQINFIRQRCSEVQCLNRKDVNVMCSWVVTAPKDLPKDQEREFFEQTYKFLEKRYGEKNVISAYVHMDETTPHMHFAFVPVIYDKNKAIDKVSAKEKITRSDLKSFHPDLEKHLERHFGREVGILNEATKEGNRSIEELKKGTAKQELNNTLQEQQKALETLQEIKSNIIPLESNLKALQDEIRGIEGVRLSHHEINEIEGKTGAFNRGKVTISVQDFEKLKEVAKKSVSLEYDLEGIKDKLHRVSNRENRMEKLAEKFKLENMDLGQKYKNLMAAFKDLSQKHMIAKKILNNKGLTEEQVEKVINGTQKQLQEQDRAREQKTIKPKKTLDMER